MGKWEEEFGYEYRKDYNKKYYETLYADIKKGLKEPLKIEFAKEGLSIAAGLTKWIVEYLETKGYDMREFKGD